MASEQIILQKRAQKIAGLRTEISEKGESYLVIEFQLIPETYCIESLFISEVLPLKVITPIPGVPDFISGIINVRGKIISIVSLKTFFNLKEIGITERNKIIIIKHNQMEFGIVADGISGMREVLVSHLAAPPVTLNGIGAEYIKGVTSQGLILLDAMAILSSNSLIVNQKA